MADIRCVVFDVDGLLTDETKVKEKVPALGDIPLLGKLFRSIDKRALRDQRG